MARTFCFSRYDFLWCSFIIFCSFLFSSCCSLFPIFPVISLRSLFCVHPGFLGHQPLVSPIAQLGQANIRIPPFFSCFVLALSGDKMHVVQRLILASCHARVLVLKADSDGLAGLLTRGNYGDQGEVGRSEWDSNFCGVRCTCAIMGCVAFQVLKG